MSLNFEALAVIAGPAVLGALLWLRARRGWSTPRVLFTGLFALYAFKAVELTRFPVPVDGDMAESFSSGPFLRFLELVPLAGIVEEGALTPAFLRNVALGVPFGFGIWFLDTSMTARRALLAGAAASTTVEILQLAVGALVGFMYRVVDINDVIANTTRGRPRHRRLPGVRGAAPPAAGHPAGRSGRRPVDLPRTGGRRPTPAPPRPTEDRGAGWPVAFSRSPMATPPSPWTTGIRGLVSARVGGPAAAAPRIPPAPP